jgi:hypothetical protein
MPLFSDCFDNGETATCVVLKQINTNKELADFLKNLNDNLVKQDDFDDEKIKMLRLLKENTKLKIQIALEKKIAEKNKNLKSNFESITEHMNNRHDFSYIDTNSQIIANKLKIMKRELKQINL